MFYILCATNAQLIGPHSTSTYLALGRMLLCPSGSSIGICPLPRGSDSGQWLYAGHLLINSINILKKSKKILIFWSFFIWLLLLSTNFSESMKAIFMRVVQLWSVRSNWLICIFCFGINFWLKKSIESMLVNVSFVPPLHFRTIQTVESRCQWHEIAMGIWLASQKMKSFRYWGNVGRSARHLCQFYIYISSTRTTSISSFDHHIQTDDLLSSLIREMPVMHGSSLVIRCIRCHSCAHWPSGENNAELGRCPDIWLACMRAMAIRFQILAPSYQWHLSNPPFIEELEKWGASLASVWNMTALGGSLLIMKTMWRR